MGQPAGAAPAFRYCRYAGKLLRLRRGDCPPTSPRSARAGVSAEDDAGAGQHGAPEPMTRHPAPACRARPGTRGRLPTAGSSGADCSDAHPAARIAERGRPGSEGRQRAAAGRGDAHLRHGLPERIRRRFPEQLIGELLHQVSVRHPVLSIGAGGCSGQAEVKPAPCVLSVVMVVTQVDVVQHA